MVISHLKIYEMKLNFIPHFIVQLQKQINSLTNLSQNYSLLLLKQQLITSQNQNHYFKMFYSGDPQQIQMHMQMQTMNPGAGMMMGMPGMINNNNNPNYFNFVGNSLSLQSRLNGMSDEQANQIIDATIVVTGRQVQSLNTCGYCCTIIWGSIIIFPLFFMCCDWWKNCVYPAYDIDFSVYASLAKLFKSPNLRNISLTVMDSTFDSNKSSFLYQMVSESRIQGFTFINQAGNWNFLKSEHSDFSKNMKPIKMLPNVMSDIRWGTQIVL